MEAEMLLFLQNYLEQMPSFYTEKQRRLCAATIAKVLGWKGKTFVHNITGLSYESIRLGIEELKFLEEVGHTDEATTYEMLEEIDRIKNPHRSRHAGGGRKLATEVYPNLREHIDHIVYECSYGDPMSSHMWTNATLDYVHEVLLHNWDIDVSRPTISKIIKELGYSLQGNKKMEQVGKSHPDRDKQFKYINALSNSFIENGYPVVSGDTKKKEYIQNTANKGREYRKKGDPRPVLDHDFHTPGGTRVIPYGLYIVNTNHGYVNIGTSYDTAEFAAASIRKWWEQEGKIEFPHATKVLFLFDGGGSNGYRSRLFKWELGKIARDCGLEIHVSHYPTGTSKWNKVEHRLFSEISKNWAAKPLVSVEIVKKYIEETKTRKGLYVHADIDEKKYMSGKRVTEKELKRITMERKDVCPNWNYVIKGINLEGYTGPL